MKNSSQAGRARRALKRDLRDESLESALATCEKVRQGEESDITHPSRDATKRYGAIPLLFEPLRAEDVVAGQIAYDSWQSGPAVALRDVTDGRLRHLTLRAGFLSLELIAERTRDRWEFVARIYSSDKICHDYVLKVGRRKLLPGSGGYFHWSSKLTPRNIELRSYQQAISFERLSWR